MGGALDAVADIGLGDIVDTALDVGSVVSDFGSEFLSAESFELAGVPFSGAVFGVPGIDLAAFNGFEQIGSFAGNSSWFDTFNPGAILDNIPSVGDFNLSSVTSSLPSLSSIKDAATSIQSDFSGFIQTAQTAGRALQSVAPAVNAVSSALGIQNPLAQVTQAVNQAVGIAGAAAGISRSATGAIGKVVGAATSVADGAGFRELNAAETAQLIKNAPLINTLTDTGIPTAANAIDVATGLPINTPRPVGELEGIGVAAQYTSVYDPETETWSVFDNITGTTVQTGLTEQAAILAEQDLNVTGTGISLNASTVSSEDPYELARLAAEERFNTAAIPLTAEEITSANNADIVARTNQARVQTAIANLRQNKAQSSDWRVRLRLAPNSSYLYNDRNPGILAALKVTDGVIFPYTPSIETAYKANYDPYELTHSNYRGYFYKNSYVDAINLRATFTAQDTNEANYLLAVIHFFRSCTKMFYGQDVQRGSPPPLVYLSGYGDYQFNEHPCVVSQFNYTLPPDVDYIRAQSTLDANTNLLGNRLRNPIANNPLAYTVNRLLNSGLLPGALDFRPSTATNLPVGSPTYVPTKMEISISMFPMQSRDQVSKNFSVKEFANGNLLKGGYW